MGDIADEHYDRMFDEHEATFSGYYEGIYRHEKPPTTCRRCGSHEVYWQTAQGQYKLYSNQTLQPHVCDEANIRKTLANDFEDLDE